jgi:hypothetical protein
VSEKNHPSLTPPGGGLKAEPERPGLSPGGEGAASGNEPGRYRTGAEPLGVAAPGSRLPVVDVGRLVGDISRTFNPLARDFALDVHASQLPGGFVRVSVVLPQGMTRAFVGLLESLAGLVRFVDHRVKISAAEVKAVDLEELADRRQLQEDHRAEVCTLFDRFTASGLDRKQAVRRTSQALKAKNHPWSTLDLVTLTLRECGRFRRGSGRPRGEPASGR